MILLPNSGWSNNNVANELSSAVTTLTSYPAEITLSENVNNFTFEPVEVVGSPNYANTVIQVFGYVTPGSTLTISSSIGTLTLTASVAPSTGEFYTEAAPIATPAYLQHVAYSIADAINASLAFFNNYNVDLLGTGIIVTAKFYSDDLDMTSSTTSGTIFIASSPSIPKYESDSLIDYQGFVEVYVGNQVFSDLVDKYTSELVDSYIINSATDLVNLTVPVVGNYVNPILPIKYLTPTNNYFQMDSGVDQAGIIIPTEDDNGANRFICRPYFLAYGDSFKYVVNGQRKKYIKGVTPVRWVQLGAFDTLLPYDMNNYVFVPNSNKSFGFLTSQPVNKTVGLNSHEYIQFIVRKTTVNNNFNVNVRWDFYDGTSTVENKTGFSYQNVGGNVSIDVSPIALNLANIEATNSKLVKSYTVRIKWSYPSGTAYSDSQTYVIDRTCYDTTKQIVFLNEYGAWDSLEFRGEISEDLTREVLTIDRALPYDANTLEGMSKEVALNVSTDTESNYTLRSGLLNDEHISWIKKLGESSSVYIWDPNYNRYRNIILTSFNYLNNTIPTSDSVEIVFKYGSSNNTISR